ncbi:hypothetical protein INR49_005112 [Caranx melampygus]|nr:hypothetical protein INR49_005112 [Caranx melampygus]
MLAEQQEEGVAVLADGGAEVHQPLVHAPVAGLHLGHLEGLAAGLWGDAILLSVLSLRKV